MEHSHLLFCTESPFATKQKEILNDVSGPRDGENTSKQDLESCEGVVTLSLGFVGVDAGADTAGAARAKDGAGAKDG